MYSLCFCQLYQIRTYCEEVHTALQFCLIPLWPSENEVKVTLMMKSLVVGTIKQSLQEVTYAVPEKKGSITILTMEGPTLRSALIIIQTWHDIWWECKKNLQVLWQVSSKENMTTAYGLCLHRFYQQPGIACSHGIKTKIKTENNPHAAACQSLKHQCRSVQTFARILPGQHDMILHDNHDPICVTFFFPSFFFFFFFLFFLPLRWIQLSLLWVCVQWNKRSSDSNEMMFPCYLRL